VDLNQIVCSVAGACSTPTAVSGTATPDLAGTQVALGATVTAVGINQWTVNQVSATKTYEAIGQPPQPQCTPPPMCAGLPQNTYGKIVFLVENYGVYLA